MPLLIFVTLLWAFSFSLIGVFLAGQVDSYFSVLTRILLAGLVFLPFFRWRGCDHRAALALAAIGAVQLGLMYLFYYQSFLLLSVPEVLLFTIFTPVYIAIFYDLLQRQFSPWNLVVAALAVAGAAVIRWDQPGDSFWKGFLVVQGANLCFAAGQVAYKQFMQRRPGLQAHSAFAWFYLGAGLVATVAWLLLGEPVYPSSATQWLVLLWLGLVASGAGYYLWNQGATKVSAGTLAAMNNALIPAGLLVNLLIWNRDADLARLGIGGAIIVSAVLVSEWRLRRGAARTNSSAGSRHG
ncbi:biotin transporter [Microbulbifer aestuariivivens]|uniref:Biotin transporter n=1 Tax=Microbulbifer aestuariivivens TaxID=1908308 RepID=A0ABP9WSQ4_9GAMM